MQIKTALSIVFFLSLITIFGCKQEEEIEEIEEIMECDQYHDTEATFIHSVYFWAKEGATDAEKAQLLKGMEELAAIKSISRVYYGPPAPTEEREVVVNSYTYAFIVHFADQAAHDAYQVDPIHLAFIEKNKDIWGKVQVYDNIISTRH